MARVLLSWMLWRRYTLVKWNLYSRRRLIHTLTKVYVKAVTSENWRLYQTVRSLLGDKLAGLTDGLLDDIDGIDQDFEVPAAGQIDDSDDGWIFDSDLEYREQLALYKERKAS